MERQGAPAVGRHDHKSLPSPQEVERPRGSVAEMFAIIANIAQPAIRMWVGPSGATAFRRSESRGLNREDCDFNDLWFYPKRGLVGKDVTQMKTEASHGRVEMAEELAEALVAWRSVTPPTATF